MIAAETTQEVAMIVPTRHGGWALLLPGAARQIGHYATATDAARFARLNGYEPQIQEATR